MFNKLVLPTSALEAMMGNCALPGPAKASLIGDSVTAGITVPNVSRFSQSGSTTATDDASGVFILTNGVLTFRVDPFDTGTVITLIDIAGPGDGFAFGSSIETATVIKLSYLWGPEVVTGASIEPTFAFAPGLISDVTYADNSVDVTLYRYGGASWSIGESVTINLTFAP